MKPPHTRRIIAAGTIGNVLEWYDFSIYGFFAVQIGATFFPGDDPISQALSAFSVFAVGYPDAAAGRDRDRLYRRPASAGRPRSPSRSPA